jgi:hypothetical protein
MKMATAYTREVDDPALACEEILGQLKLEQLDLERGHAAALIFCHAEFIESGTALALCDALPMPALGCTSQVSGVREDADEIFLSVAVLWGDEVRFAAGVSGSLADAYETRIGDFYRAAAASLPGKPALVFALLPVMTNCTGDIMLSLLDNAAGGDVPIFGSAAEDADSEKVRHPYTFYYDPAGGVPAAAYRDRMTALLMQGPIKPRFFSAEFPNTTIAAQDAIITAARGSRLIAINNMRAVTYLEKIGVYRPNALNTLYIAPLIINYRDGTPPVSLSVNDVTPEGSLLCSRPLRVGGVLNAGASTSSYVIESAVSLARNIRLAGEGSALFFVSCYLRNILLGGENLAEIAAIRKELEDFTTPYLLFYSWGEICPRFTGGGKPINRFLQTTLAACLL